jgi:hypothetical protein
MTGRYFREIDQNAGLSLKCIPFAFVSFNASRLGKRKWIHCRLFNSLQNQVLEHSPSSRLEKSSKYRLI